MVYKVQATLYFTKEDEANDFYYDCENALPKSAPVNPGQANEQSCFILLEQCHHDENPSIPCVVIDYACLPAVPIFIP